MNPDELEALVCSLVERVAALEEDNARLRADAAVAAEGPVSRRQWLARGAVITAGVVAAGAAGVASGPGIAAAAGNPLELNVANSATTFTRLSADVSAPNTAVLQLWNLSAVGGAGVQGIGADEGVLGSSTQGLGGWFYGGAADVRLGNSRVVTPPADGQGHTRGEIAFVNGLSDSGDFWACVQSGTPGSWRRLTGYTSAGSLTVLSAPVRVYDSRSGQIPTAIGPKTPLANGVDRDVAMTANLSGVPTDVNAVLVNLTVVNQNGAGWLSVRAKGTTYNGHSNLNFPVGGAVANMCLSRCVDGQISVRLGGSATTCNVAVDVLGYLR